MTNPITADLDGRPPLQWLTDALTSIGDHRTPNQATLDLASTQEGRERLAVEIEARRDTNPVPCTLLTSDLGGRTADAWCRALCAQAGDFDDPPSTMLEAASTDLGRRALVRHFNARGRR